MPPRKTKARTPSSQTDRRSRAQILQTTESGLDSPPRVVEKLDSAMSDEETFDPALRAANLALTGRKHREFNRIASIEHRSIDARNGPWEAVAMLSVGVFTLLFVCAAWFW